MPRRRRCYRPQPTLENWSHEVHLVSVPGCLRLIGTLSKGSGGPGLGMKAVAGAWARTTSRRIKIRYGEELPFWLRYRAAGAGRSLPLVILPVGRNNIGGGYRTLAKSRCCGAHPSFDAWYPLHTSSALTRCSRHAHGQPDRTLTQAQGCFNSYGGWTGNFPCCPFGKGR